MSNPLHSLHTSWLLTTFQELMHSHSVKVLLLSTLPAHMTHPCLPVSHSDIWGHFWRYLVAKTLHTRGCGQLVGSTMIAKRAYQLSLLRDHGQTTSETIMGTCRLSKCWSLKIQKNHCTFSLSMNVETTW
jgi:hypothetical protein